MRLKLTFQANQSIIPINYQHFLSSAIYGYLGRVDKVFANALHNNKNFVGDRNFKFFVFSWLQIPKKQIVNSSIKILSNEIQWYISSPWSEFVQNLLDGLLRAGNIRIGNVKLPIVQVEILPSENFAEVQKFICLSPIVVTTKKEHNGKLEKYYYKPTDSTVEISEKIRQNLVKKYEAFFGHKVGDTTLKIVFDEKYIKTEKSQVLTHYIKLDNRTGRILDIKIPAIMCPFTAIGSRELIKFGYECGFGELNSAGFGMVKVYG